VDTTRKKEARTTKDNMAEYSNGGARIDVALVERGDGSSEGQEPVEKYCRSLVSHWG